MMTLSDIKKRPFCSAKGLGLFRVICMEPKWHQVHCQNCGARGPVGETFEEAVDLWNAGVKD